jgi:hypothetical protein
VGCQPLVAAAGAACRLSPHSACCTSFALLAVLTWHPKLSTCLLPPAAGPGGAGVYGLMNAYLRTGAHQLSPEPGMEGQQAAAAAAAPQRPPLLLHPYSPGSPLAATPTAPRAAAAGQPAPRGGITPSSVCSNGAVDSSSPAASISLGGGCGGAAGAAAAASVPRLNLAALQQGPGAADDTEISFGAALGGQPDSPGGGELPTARFAPVGGPAAAPQQQQEEEENGTAAHQQHQRHGPPSPITFCLPGDSPPQAARQPAAAAATGSPSAFSFGMGGAALPAAAASLEQQAEAGPGAAAAEAAPEQPVVCTEAEAAAGGALASRPAMHRIDSGETVQQPLPQQRQQLHPSQQQQQQQPNPFTAMLVHLRGPQYASPARFMHQQDPDSPQSPQQCTPLHLISTSDGTAGQGLASPSGARPPTLLALWALASSRCLHLPPHQQPATLSLPRLPAGRPLCCLSCLQVQWASPPPRARAA